MIVAIAGRRIDAPDAPTPRFPAENEGRVGDRLRRVFEELGATVVVASAACGADLVALEVAGAMGLGRVVVIPWGRERFRERSVVDRGQSWGKRYDRVLDEIEADDNLHVLTPFEDDEAAFAATNDAILSEARELAAEAEEGIAAISVWDGKSRGPDDFTAQFVNAARALGLEIREVSTLERR